jgi:hypothetical protein
MLWAELSSPTSDLEPRTTALLQDGITLAFLESTAEQV